MTIAAGRLEVAKFYGRHGKLPDYRDHQPPAPTADETAETLERITLEDLRNDDAIRWHMERNARLRDMGLAHTIEPVNPPLPPPVSHAQHVANITALHREKVAELVASIPPQDLLTLPERSHQQQMAAWLEPFPLSVRWGLTRAHQRLEDRYGAARADWYVATFNELHSGPVIDWRASDADIADKAKHHAAEVAKMVPGLLARSVLAVKRRHRHELDAHQTIRERERRAYSMVRAYVDALGLVAPKAPKKFSKGTITCAGLINRLCGKRWWRRVLTRWQDQGLQAIERTLGLIHAQAAYAASNSGTQQVKYRRTKTAKLLEDLDAISEDGEVMALVKLIEKSPANPYIRFVELMTRVKGMSRLADAYGFCAKFITWTLESRFHSHYRETGARNSKWDGVTVNDGRAELQALWVECRALFAKEKLRVYGQRGAEPHHDGCPHWHLLLFIHPDDQARVLQIMRWKAEASASGEVSHDDKGDSVRFKVVDIERDKDGSLKAANYIAKYLTKNIAGAKLDRFIAKSGTGDLFGALDYVPPVADNSEGNSAEAMTARVRAWASLWRIRQFQVFGCPPIGTWRELRRMGKATQADPTIEAARTAADSGDWKGFALAIGAWDEKRNAPAPRGQLKLRLYKQADNRPNRYGERRPDEIKGVMASVVFAEPAPPSLETLVAAAARAEARLAARELAVWVGEGGSTAQASPVRLRGIRQFRRAAAIELRPACHAAAVAFEARKRAHSLANPVVFAITRRVRWTISRRAVAGSWTRVTNCNQHGGAHGPDTGPRTGPPRENQRANR